jgi:hypothetical protein
MVVNVDCWGDQNGVFVLGMGLGRSPHTEGGIYGTVHLLYPAYSEPLQLDAAGHARVSFTLPPMEFSCTFQGFYARSLDSPWRATRNFVEAAAYANADASHVLGAWCNSESLVLRAAGRYRPLRVLDVWRNGAFVAGHPSNFAIVDLRMNVPSIANTQIRDGNTVLLRLV